MTTKIKNPNWHEAIGEPALDSIRKLVRGLDIETAAEDFAKDLDRARCVELLETVCIECRDDESTEELREAVAVNLGDGTIEPSIDGFDWTYDDARQAIEEDALSVLVRSDWHMPGSGDTEPAEYELLLGTGRPAIRIIGELDQYCEPRTAKLEVQDWWKPWTEYSEPGAEDLLLYYAQQFLYGY